MRRRDLIVLFGGAAAGRFASAFAYGGLPIAWPAAARAQRAKLPKIGVLLVASREPLSKEFQDGLAELGYVDGRNIQLEFRSADENLAALAGLAAELVKLDVDVIVASETPAVAAAKRATATIPIVMAPAGDPLGTGLVSSLSRPGGNVTGLSAAAAELAGKSLELVREMMPSVRRVAALADPSNPFSKPFLEHIHLSSRDVGVEILVVNVNGTEGFDDAFAGMKRDGAEAVIVQPTLPRKLVTDSALKYRLPSISGNRAFADSGGLLSYAGSITDRYRNAAVYVDKILKGAKPSDLPVQQPVKFELIVNQKTARALGIAVPATLLARADEVIE